MAKPEFFSPVTSLTKLVIYWKDNSPAARYYSADRKLHRERNQPELGMKRLERLFVQPNVGKFNVALIYENRHDGALLRKYDEDGRLLTENDL